MKKKLISLALLAALTTSTFASSFSDVSDTYVYSREIEYIKSNNIATGFSDGTYRPDAQITRAELTKMVINSAFSESEITGCQLPTEGNLFSDVTNSNKFITFICLAKQKGIINGYSDGSYKPENKITVGEASKIIMRTLDSNLAISPTDLAGYLSFLQEKGAYPPTLTYGNKDAIVTRGEIAFLIRTVRENYQVLEPLPRATYEVMLRSGEEKTIPEVGLKFRIWNHGIHCSSGAYTFVDLNVTKGTQSQRIHLQRSCVGIGDGGEIQGDSTAEADAFGYHFVLSKVIERVTYQANTFEYYIQFK